MNKIITFLMCLYSISVYANQPYGRIVDVRGSAFLSFDGKTKEVKKGDVIYSGSELIVEDSAQVAFTDNADHRFHLSSSSSVALSGKELELRSGDLWFQSLNKVDEYKILTANSEVYYTGGEAILTYDNQKGRSQLMVINGLMKLGNLRAPELNLRVAEGNFSFVDNSYEEGAPRDPTPAGEKTYKSLVSIFKNISPIEKNSADLFKDTLPVSREIASVVEESKNEVKPEVKNEKKPIAKKIVAKKIKPAKKTEPVIVHIYGRGVMIPSEELTPVVTPVRTRAPASVNEETPIIKEYKESERLIEQLNTL